jgi:hypothetical protein
LVVLLNPRNSVPTIRKLNCRLRRRRDAAANRHFIGLEASANLRNSWQHHQPESLHHTWGPAAGLAHFNRYINCMEPMTENYQKRGIANREREKMFYRRGFETEATPIPISCV